MIFKDIKQEENINLDEFKTSTTFLTSITLMPLLYKLTSFATLLVDNYHFV